MRSTYFAPMVLALLAPFFLHIDVAEAAAPRCAGFKATIVGTDRSERIVGTRRRDVIVARGGHDKIEGRGGLDIICGGRGNDRIFPGPGVGGLSYGEQGNDTLAAGDDGQALYGGPGNDTLKTAWEGTLLEGNGGHDKLYGGAHPDVINGGDGNDRISAGGGDDVRLTGGFGTDTCLGGPGRDHCHGGSPGGPGNSPTDPDVCEAEAMKSCRGDELPTRWLATVKGHESWLNEVQDWEVKMVLVRHGDPTTTTIWRQESVTGSFSIQGRSENCAWTHTGELGSKDFTGDLGLSPAESLYWFDVVVGGEGERVKSCGSHTSVETDYFQVWAATGGGPDTEHWDRSRREITGGYDDEDSDIDWVITPLG